MSSDCSARVKLSVNPHANRSLVQQGHSGSGYRHRTFATLDFYGKQIDRNKTQKDSYQIGAQEQRFEALERVLGPNAVAGYVLDLPDAGILLSAQHALAPVLLVDDVPYQLVVGNFSRPMDYAAFGRARKLVLVKDFGNGVTLFRKADG